MTEHVSQDAPGSFSALEKSRAETLAQAAQYVSPALAQSRSQDAAAYEVKCLISGALAEDLERHLGSLMVVDPFAAKEPNGQYRITTLSTDTAARDCFYRTPGYAKRKYRLRRYGSESRVYLEQKTRRGYRVNKRRVATTESELQSAFSAGDCCVQKNAADAVIPDPQSEGRQLWNLQMFHNRMGSLNLQPVCLMTYERSAWFAETESGSVRWTLDRGFSGAMWNEWTLEPTVPLLSILSPDQVICEFKFSGSMPQLFKRILHEYQISPGGFSKYRNCLSRLTGLALSKAVPSDDSGETESNSGEENSND